jgi:DNA-binding response OmpR family regulator
MRVLVAEDDRALGLFLQKGLMLEGHEVDWVSDGHTALAKAMELTPDLMVLDLSLPGMDGVEVLEAMHERMSGTAVLVLTGRSQVEERVRCLNLGADDCLLKPFSFHELTARCRAILRRRRLFADPVLRFGGVEMNRVDRQVKLEGVSVELTPKEFLMLEHSPADVGTNVVDVYVNYLRKKLSAAVDAAEAGSVIETVRGSGYRLRPKSEAEMAEGRLLMKRNTGS